MWEFEDHFQTVAVIFLRFFLTLSSIATAGLRPPARAGLKVFAIAFSGRRHAQKKKGAELRRSAGLGDGLDNDSDNKG